MEGSRSAQINYGSVSAELLPSYKKKLGLQCKNNNYEQQLKGLTKRTFGNIYLAKFLHTWALYIYENP